MKRWPVKDPDEVLDYDVDWETRLAGDTIAAVVWTVPSGLTQTDEDFNDTVATVWLSGGVDGTNYEVGCLITTVGGRTFDITVNLPVRDR